MEKSRLVAEPLLRQNEDVVSLSSRILGSFRFVTDRYTDYVRRYTAVGTFRHQAVDG